MFQSVMVQSGPCLPGVPGVPLQFAALRQYPVLLLLAIHFPNPLKPLLTITSVSVLMHIRISDVLRINYVGGCLLQGNSHARHLAGVGVKASREQVKGDNPFQNHSAVGVTC